MINLLSDAKKAEIRAGRVNVILLRYISMSLIAFVLLAIMVAGAFVVLTTSRSLADERVTKSTQAASSHTETRTEADVFRKNLTRAKDILSKDIKYSQAILRIARTVPKNVVLQSLELSPESVGKPIEIQAMAKSESDALALKESFQSQEELFSDVKLVSINLNNSSGEERAAYPVQVSISCIISKEALK